MKFKRKKIKNPFKDALKNIRSNPDVRIITDRTKILKPAQMSAVQLREECHKVWAKIVKLESGHKCQWYRCTKTNGLHAHHICSAQHCNIQYNPVNGVALCLHHHMFVAHKNNLHVYFWLPTIRSQKILRILYDKSLEPNSKKPYTKIQLIGILSRLNYQLKRLKG